jgi:hypothetical protein
LDGLATEDVGGFYGHLVHFTVFCYISWTLGVVRGNFVSFPPFWYFATTKNLATLAQTLLALICIHLTARAAKMPFRYFSDHKTEPTHLLARNIRPKNEEQHALQTCAMFSLRTQQCGDFYKGKMVFLFRFDQKICDQSCT